VNYKKKDDKYFACIYCVEADGHDDKEVIYEYTSCGSFGACDHYSEMCRTRKFKNIEDVKIVVNDEIYRAKKLINKRRNKLRFIKKN
jgi:hypothetical protein